MNGTNTDAIGRGLIDKNAMMNEVSQFSQTNFTNNFNFDDGKSKRG
jgi:hypothetical protein